MSWQAGPGRKHPGAQSRMQFLRIALMIVAGALVALPADRAAAASLSCPNGGTRSELVRVFPGQDLDLDTSKAAAFLLLEELGADIEYRWGADAEFQEIASRPARLGFAVLPRRSGSITLRVKAGQGDGQVRMSCLSPVDAVFFSMLVDIQTRHLGEGAAAAAPGLPLLAELMEHDPSPFQLAWLENARANILVASGAGDASIDAFKRSRDTWLAVDEPARAGIALMAAGENASRGGRFDEARSWLSTARDELMRTGITYYALRSEAAICTTLSRQGRYRDSMACEDAVAAKMHASGEHAEAAVRHISIGNQHLRFGEYAAARDQFLQADRHRADLTPIGQSRLSSAFGMYFLLTGDIPAAVQELALASQRLGDQGLPAEQANIDLKLALLAQVAGALVEQRRLLDRAIAQLGGKSAPMLRADAQIQLARTLIELGAPGKALELSRTARETCRALQKSDCIQASQFVDIDALIDLGKTSDARSVLTELAVDSTSATNVKGPVIHARIDLAEGHAARAVHNLAQVRTVSNDFDAQAQYAMVAATAFLATGNSADAAQLLETALNDQALVVRSWPSIALRISARNRLTDLQAHLFDSLLSPVTGVELASDAIERIVLAVDAVGPHELLRAPARAELPDSVRRKLSDLVTANSDEGQRELFIALAGANDAKDVDPPLKGAHGFATLDGDRDLVLMPLAGASQFTLVAWRAGVARVCRGIPIHTYSSQVRDFERALDGEPSDLPALESLAREWHQAVRTCEQAIPPAAHWHVVSTPGTRPLPWAWIAASGADNEPDVSTVFGFPRETDSSIATDLPLSLVDLNMSGAAPLPFATRERESIQSAGSQRPIRHIDVATAHGSRTLLDAMSEDTVLHIIGHANPAAYGQLYQGLWFESAGMPKLLTYPEIASAPSRAQLVVLSACGTNYAGRAEFGASSLLAEAFIAAGARHVVAASNALSDTAAPVWTGAFHNELRETRSVAIAARQARAALRGSPHFRHPRFWAGIEAYSAVGATRRVDASSSALVTTQLPLQGKYR